MRKLIITRISAAILLAVLFVTSAGQMTVRAEKDLPSDVSLPSLSAQSAILIEAETGSVLYQKNADTSLPMASTTKIMTAIVAIEAMDPQTTVSVPANAVGIEGSSVYLYAGEQLTMEELLYALLLESANDAATAIAITVAGSVEAFADKMNQKAVDLGLAGTHFTNPHGLDHEEHYTTARDLAVLSAYCMKNPLFATIVSTQRKTIPLHNNEGVRLLLNHNRLLRTYEGVIGIKTGYTKRSGRCLVSACERDGLRLIAVTINAPDDWEDHAQMYDYGFNQLTCLTLADDREIFYQVPIIGGAISRLSVSNHGALKVILPKDHGEIQLHIELPRWYPAGIEQGQTVGYAVFFCENAEIARTPLIADEGVPQLMQNKNIFQRIVDWFVHLLS